MPFILGFLLGISRMFHFHTGASIACVLLIFVFTCRDLTRRANFTWHVTPPDLLANHAIVLGIRNKIFFSSFFLLGGGGGRAEVTRLGEFGKRRQHNSTIVRK